MPSVDTLDFHWILFPGIAPVCDAPLRPVLGDVQKLVPEHSGPRSHIAHTTLEVVLKRKILCVDFGGPTLVGSADSIESDFLKSTKEVSRFCLLLFSRLSRFS